jgi:membrane dipeptidase
MPMEKWTPGARSEPGAWSLLNMLMKIAVPAVIAGWLIALPVQADSSRDLSQQAAEIARRQLLVDTHIDVPYRLEEEWSDVTAATEDGDFDYPRARAGGLNVPFMSIYTPPKAEAEGKSHEIANRLIDRVEAMVGRAPEKMVVVKSPAEAEKAMEKGLMGLAMGMENGSPLAGRIQNVAFFAGRGISYITLAHSMSNHVSDSSYDEERKWNGLSPFGREVVAEMNRQGMMIDVSHVSDEAFAQVLELSTAPVIASHSSARHFTPGWERNMSDEMIQALAAEGGVIQVNFGSSFLTEEARQWYEAMGEAREAYLEHNGFEKDSPEATGFREAWTDKHPLPFASLDDLVAHFRHIVELVGVEHVGIGSDFDGLGDSLPTGMKDVADYPNLIEEFLGLGYTEKDIAAIMGGNLMRVWREVEAQAQVKPGD